MAHVAAAVAREKEASTVTESSQNGMMAAESGPGASGPGATHAAVSPQGGLVIEGHSFANIVRLADGSLITEAGWQSRDEGRSWQQGEIVMPDGSLALLRLPNGDLGVCSADRWDMETALGNVTNNWFFRWSADEGKTWSPPVKITLDGLTQGLRGAMFNLGDRTRTILFTYSQFLGSRFDKRGSSWGTFQGVRFQTETEGHFPLAEVGRAYYSDDNGRCWQACDGWIMGWREEAAWTDAFTEPDAVELTDGRILCVGRTLTGRLYQAFSPDRGHSWWPGAQPMELMAPYSPARICRLPETGDLMILWNQHSRAEIRKGFRRSRLSTAISRDEAATWECFRNLEAIECMTSTTRVPLDPDLTPVVGDAEVGEVPADFAHFHYPAIAVVGSEVFINYPYSGYRAVTDAKGERVVEPVGGSRTRILPVSWFYEDC